MHEKKINIKFYLLPTLIIFSFLVRLVSAYFFRDTEFDNEWSTLIDNLINYKTYAFYTFNSVLIPSVYMPPLYPFFVFAVNAITSVEKQNLLYIIIFLQIILSVYSIYLFYEINKNFFSQNISLVNSTILSIIPLNIYASGQISSITLQMFFSFLFLKFLLVLIKDQSIKNIVIFSITSGLLVLTRGEFVLIFFSLVFFIYINKKISLTNLIKIFIITFLVLSPYLIRNYTHFNQIILVKSLGYNLWKGNNPFSTVGGFELGVENSIEIKQNFRKTEFQNLKLKITNLKENKYYEINRDDVFLSEAIENLSKYPKRYLILFFKKFYSYFFIDMNSNYPNYYNFFHIFPIIIISLFSIPGLFIFYKKNRFENQCFGMYLFLNLIIFSIFFILPRYKLIILPVQIILIAYFFIYMFQRFKKN